MIEVSGIPLSLDALLPENAHLQQKEIARALGVEPQNVQVKQLLRKSVDARKKSNVHFTTTFVCSLDTETEQSLLASPPKGLHVKQFKPYEPLMYPDLSQRCDDHHKIVVVGMGPAGLFCALYLARCGLKPLVIERGFDVDRRAHDINGFNATGALNPHSNIQFGEGGAGTFSDGKLTTTIKNRYVKEVLHWFVQAGAPQEILVEAHPHIGSDKLPDVVRHMRNEICERGGEVRFGTRLSGWCIQDDQTVTLDLEEVETGHHYEQTASAVVLACGHSARDVFELCAESGLVMEQKPFSVGVRIEHLQKDINADQWGSAANHPALGAAEYKLAVHLPNGRSVYTFCMCPGGEVVAAASEEGGIVTNGMSVYDRSGTNANSALLVSVGPEDFGSSDVLAGVEFQRRIEQAAFALAQKHNAQPYQAPYQSVGEFLAERQQSSKNASRKIAHSYDAATKVLPSYSRGVFSASLSECLPSFVTESLAQALVLMGKKLAHFDNPSALMTAPETRSSSPIRIKRSDTLQAYRQNPADASASADTHIFPCGEGPGYAGGIMSAACDGIRVAQAVVQHLYE